MKFPEIPHIMTGLPIVPIPPNLPGIAAKATLNALKPIALLAASGVTAGAGAIYTDSRRTRTASFHTNLAGVKSGEFSPPTAYRRAVLDNHNLEAYNPFAGTTDPIKNPIVDGIGRIFPRLDNANLDARQVNRMKGLRAYKKIQQAKANPKNLQLAEDAKSYAAETHSEYVAIVEANTDSNTQQCTTHPPIAVISNSKVLQNVNKSTSVKIDADGWPAELIGSDEPALNEASIDEPLMQPSMVTCEAYSVPINNNNNIGVTNFVSYCALGVASIYVLYKVQMFFFKKFNEDS